MPISSLGHSVLLPDWFGWHNLVKAQSADESFYLAFLVALHVATALALLVHYRETWVRIVVGFVRTFRTRRIETPDERLAWLLVVGTIPVGAIGLPVIRKEVTEAFRRGEGHYGCRKTGGIARSN